MRGRGEGRSRGRGTDALSFPLIPFPPLSFPFLSFPPLSFPLLHRLIIPTALTPSHPPPLHPLYALTHPLVSHSGDVVAYFTTVSLPLYPQYSPLLSLPPFNLNISYFFLFPLSSYFLSSFLLHIFFGFNHQAPPSRTS